MLTLPLVWKIGFTPVSTTIATSVVSKFGEDIYAFLKNEVVSLSSKRRRKKQLIQEKIRQLEKLKTPDPDFNFLDETDFRRIEDDIRDLSRKEDEVDKLDK